jgi:hypothetical protein
MPAEPYTMECRDGVIVVTLKKGNQVTPECIMNVISQKHQLYDVKQYSALWDFRGVLPSDNFGYDAVERIIDYVANHPREQWNPKVAILVDAGVQYGLSRMFQTLADQLPVQIRIFYDDTEAQKWVACKMAADHPEGGVPS